MIKAFVYSVVSVVVGLILFSLVAPLIFQPESLRMVGQIAFPMIVIVFGTAGFVVGRRRRKQ